MYKKEKGPPKGGPGEKRGMLYEPGEAPWPSGEKRLSVKI
jgi:hypothetical protein